MWLCEAHNKPPCMACVAVVWGTHGQHPQGACYACHTAAKSLRHHLSRQSLSGNWLQALAKVGSGVPIQAEASVSPNGAPWAGMLITKPYPMGGSREGERLGSPAAKPSVACDHV